MLVLEMLITSICSRNHKFIGDHLRTTCVFSTILYPVAPIFLCGSDMLQFKILSNHLDNIIALMSEHTLSEWF